MKDDQFTDANIDGVQPAETAKPAEVDIVKPIPNIDAWGLEDDEMPAALDADQLQHLNDEMEASDRAIHGTHTPDISQGSEVNYG